MVTLSYTADVSGIPTGDMGTLFTLPEKYRPAFSIRTMTFPGEGIQIIIDTAGKVTAHNYGSASPSNMSARFLMTYVAAS